MALKLRSYFHVTIKNSNFNFPLIKCLMHSARFYCQFSQKYHTIIFKRLYCSQNMKKFYQGKEHGLLKTCGVLHIYCNNRNTSTIPEKIVAKSGPLKPYLELMRINKPIGCWFLFWPFSWSIAAASAPGCSPNLYCLLMFFTMSVIMRGAGCTINDMWDRNIDSQVLRTKDRPLARNELSQFDALVLLGGQLGFGCLILLQYNFYTIMLSASSLVLAVTYPLMKKIIPWPQMVLGMAMNWGALLGSPAVNGYSEWSVCLPLYIGGICWTMVYDTIYAYQDVNDDKRLGLKSSAISFKEFPKLWLGGFSAAMISSLITYGLINSQTLPYYCSLSIISAILAHHVCTLNINEKTDCNKKFLSNQRIGLILFIGIVSGNLLRTESKKHRDNNVKDTSRFIVSDKAAVGPL